MALVLGIVALLVSSGPTTVSGQDERAAAQSTSAAGDLDLSFGVGGRVITDFGRWYSMGNALAIQTDGKIIAAGVSSAIDIFYGEDFVIARYNPDGSIDSTFGSGGKVITDFFAYQDQIHDVAIQPDGKIVAIGFARSAVAPLTYLTIVRYNQDGSLDASFGSGGTVLTLPPGGTGIGNAVVLQPDGKIVVAGRSDMDDIFPTLWRYNPDGSLDSSFGSVGFVTRPRPGEATSLVLQVDGKLVIGGFDRDQIQTNQSYNYALTRYNPDGSLDRTFGKSGEVSTDFFGFNDIGRALALQPDGKLLMAGDVGPNDEDVIFGLARYNLDGSLDRSFGNEGRVGYDVTGLGVSVNYDVATQANGKIVTAGWSLVELVPGQFESVFALARFNINGSLDTSFGSGGTVTTQVGSSAGASALALQENGKIVALGGNLVGFALARFEGWGFDICIQDDTNGNLFRFNSTNGDYQFSNCRKATTLSGSGQLTADSCKIGLQDLGPTPKRPDRRVLVRVNQCSHVANASIQTLSTGTLFTINDGDITNNTCDCR